MNSYAGWLRWTLFGVFAAGLLGFVGLWIEFRTLHFVSDPQGRWQTLALLEGTRLCACVGLGLGGIYAAARVSDAPLLSVIPSAFVGGLIGSVVAAVFPFVWDSARAGLERGEYAEIAPRPGRPKNGLGSKVIGGTYYNGEGEGVNIRLTLKPDRSYTAEWRGCGGKYGDAAGHWSVTKTTLTLAPATEHDMMKGYLRTFDVVDVGDRMVLVAPPDRGRFTSGGINRYSCFQREDQFVENEFY